MQPSENTKHSFYPIGLNLTGKSVLVMGAGKVASRKLERLLKHDCVITIVSSALSEECQAQLSQGTALAQVAFRLQAYTPSLLEELLPDLVFACTNDPAVNHQIAEDAKKLGIFINSATQGIIESDFIVPGLLDYEELQIALFSGGASPLFLHQLRESIEALVGPWVKPYLQVVRYVRGTIQERVATESQRKVLYERLLNDPLLLQEVCKGDISVERLSDRILHRLLDDAENKAEISESSS